MAIKMTVQDLIEQTKQLQKQFEEVEERPWTVETYVIELLAETGTLADSIMIREGYRSLRPDQVVSLEDDVCDILFVLIMLSNYYNIDLECAYSSMITNTLHKLAQRKEVLDHDNRTE